MSALEEAYIMKEALKILLPPDFDIDTMQEVNDEEKVLLKKAQEISNDD